MAGVLCPQALIDSHGTGQMMPPRPDAIRVTALQEGRVLRVPVAEAGRSGGVLLGEMWGACCLSLVPWPSLGWTPLAALPSGTSGIRELPRGSQSC